MFLAGATGRLGARILRELLLADPALQVRAGARDAARAQAFLETAVTLGVLPADAARRVSIVEVDLTEPDAIRAALGGASKVGCWARVFSGFERALAQNGFQWGWAFPCSGTVCPCLPPNYLHHQRRA